MNILITGATSFIGKVLAQELINRGYEVYGTFRPDSPRKEGLPAGLHPVECSLNEPEKLLDAGIPKITVCIALAWGETTREGRMDRDAQEHNVACTLKVMETVKQLGCERFIFAGSQAEYGVTMERVSAGECPKEKITEMTPARPISEYGKCKLQVLKEGRKLAASLGMTYIHMRIFSTYGPGDTPTSLVSVCMKAFTAGEPVTLSPCRQMWNYLYVRDCAAAIAGLAECPFILSPEDEECEHVVNVASEVSMQLSAYVRLIHETIGTGTYTHEEKSAPAEGTPWLDADITKLKAYTGFTERIEFTEGIKLLAEDARCRMNGD